jgi:hypothetical protein
MGVPDVLRPGLGPVAFNQDKDCMVTCSCLEQRELIDMSRRVLSGRLGVQCHPTL